MAKAGLWAVTDAEERKRGERTGLDTLVVHAVNGGCWMWGPFHGFRVGANALSIPPGTVSISLIKLIDTVRGPAQAAEHAD